MRDPAAIAPVTDSKGFREIIQLAALVCVVVHAGFIVLFAGIGATGLAWFNVLSVAMHATAYTFSRRHTPLALVVAGALIGSEVVLHGVVATVLIGWETGFHLLIIPSVPVTLLNHKLSLRAKITLAGLVTAIYLALGAFVHGNTPLYGVPPAVMQGLYVMNIVTLFGSLSLLSIHYHDMVERAQRRLSDIAWTDPLTGAMNRRHLLEVATREWARSRRHQGALSVVMCDIDHFKSINDRLGHDGGDVVLRTVCDEISAAVRTVDSVCRWGGEEFLILLPQTDLIGALVLAERIRCRVRTAVVMASRGPATVTLTLGVATLHGDEAFEAVVSRADAALYRGKAGGRDRVASEAELTSPVPRRESTPS